MSDLPSQSAEDIETLRQILNIPGPRDTMPRSSTIFGLDNEKGQQELRPRGPSAMLPLSSYLIDASQKFQQDFQVSNLPEAKHIKSPASTSKWYKVGQPCFENRLQDLNSESNSEKSVSVTFLGILWTRSPYRFSEFEHQARKNISMVNLAATSAKTASVCNSTMKK